MSKLETAATVAKASVPKGMKEVVALYGDPRGSIAGRPSPTWEAQNIVRMTLPYIMYLAWDTDVRVSSIRVHRLVAPDLREILENVHDRCRLSVKQEHGWDRDTAFYDRETARELRRLGLDLFGGAYNYRLKRGGNTLSTHSWGIAIDLDPARNGMGDSTPALPVWVAEMFEARGWVWGGRWKGRNVDAMHFQRAAGV